MTISDDKDRLLTFYNFPIEHLGPVHAMRTVGLDRQRWRVVNALHVLARTGVRVESGQILERPEVVAA